jgi:hypothetical protein
VYEADDGALVQLPAALKRARLLKCSVCKRSGATVGCCAGKCAANFHFPCAVAVGAQFCDNKQVFCVTHRADRNNTVVGFGIPRLV